LFGHGSRGKDTDIVHLFQLSDFLGGLNTVHDGQLDIHLSRQYSFPIGLKHDLPRSDGMHQSAISQRLPNHPSQSDD